MSSEPSPAMALLQQSQSLARLQSDRHITLLTDVEMHVHVPADA